MLALACCRWPAPARPGLTTAYEPTFAKRFPPELQARAESRQGRASWRPASRSSRCMAAEAQRIEAALPKGVAPGACILDERERHQPHQRCSWPSASNFWRGRRAVTSALHHRRARWPASRTSRPTADETLRLSDLTLPHAFARVLLAEGALPGVVAARGAPLPPRVIASTPSMPRGRAWPCPTDLPRCALPNQFDFIYLASAEPAPGASSWSRSA